MKIVLILAVVFFSVHCSAQDKIKIVVFDAELVDSSAEGEIYGVQVAQSQRLENITQQLRAGLTESGLYDVVNMNSIEAVVTTAKNRVRYLHDCNECDVDLAREIGASQSVVVWVQKVSNLILNLNVVIKDTASGAPLKTAFVDIRGNNDKSWQRGMRYMIKNRILN